MRDITSIIVIVIIGGVGWYIYSDYSARQERIRAEALLEQRAANERAAKENAEELKHRAEMEEARRKTDQDARQREDEKQRERDRLAKLATDKATLDARIRAEAQAKLEAERKIRQAEEENRRLSEMNERRRQDREQREQQMQLLEAARHDLIAAKAELADLNGKKFTLEAGILTLNNKKETASRQLRAQQASLANYEAMNSRRSYGPFGYHYDREIAQARNWVAGLQNDIAKYDADIQTTLGSLASVNEQVKQQAEIRDRAQAQLNEQGAGLDPNVPINEQANSYPIYKLKDGREISAEHVVAADGLVSIRDKNGQFITVSQSDIKEIVKPAEKLNPAGAAQVDPERAKTAQTALAAVWYKIGIGDSREAVNQARNVARLYPDTDAGKEAKDLVAHMFEVPKPSDIQKLADAIGEQSVRMAAAATAPSPLRSISGISLTPTTPSIPPIAPVSAGKAEIATQLPADKPVAPAAPAAPATRPVAPAAPAIPAAPAAKPVTRNTTAPSSRVDVSAMQKSAEAAAPKIPQDALLATYKESFQKGKGFYTQSTPGAEGNQQNVAAALEQFILCEQLYMRAKAEGLHTDMIEGMQQDASMLRYACMKMIILSQ